MALSFWKTNALGDPVFDDPVKTGMFLARESGLLAAATRAGHALDVIEAPRVKLNQYNADMLELAGKAGDMMNSDLQKLIDLGYPRKQCEEVAERKARRFMEDESEIIRAKYPFIDDTDALYTISAKAGVHIGEARPPPREVAPPTTKLAPTVPSKKRTARRTKKRTKK